MTDIESLIHVMKRLRGADGCPWDREQTKEKLKWYLVEECYEVLDAIDKGSAENLKEELGDILFQIVFLAEISQEEGDFDMFDVVNSAREKMIRRHPHVFDGKSAKDSNEVKKIWWKIKKEEKSKEGNSVLDSIPQSLPSLLMAFKITKRAAHADFCMDTADGVLGKLEKAIGEFRKKSRDNDAKRMERDLGDILFSLADLGRTLGINPEEALRKTIMEFVSRFKEMERSIGSKVTND